MAVLVIFIAAHRGGGEAVDAHIYWVAAHDPGAPYATQSLPGDQDYHYSPAFAQLIAPLSWLPYESFAIGWMVLQLAVLVLLVNPIVALVLLLNPFVGLTEELIIGNIHVLLAGAVVASFRWPAVWAFPILTKVTPGIGIAWFVARAEWRNLLMAVFATAGVAIVSAILAPAAWTDWIRWLFSNPPVPATQHQLLAWAPLTIRLPIAMGLVVVAARLDWRWLVPFGIWLSLPVIWYNSPVLLAAAIPLARDDVRRRQPDATTVARVDASRALGRSA